MDFDIASARLEAQLLTHPKCKSAKAVVSHFGAIQAQDFQMSKWAVGSRLPQSSDATIEKAIDKGEIIRTHVLRPTWHLAASEDIGWMLDLTRENILRQFKAINVKLGLDAKTLSKSTDLIARSLEGKNHLTREELVAILNAHGIKTNEYRSLLILAYAELMRVVCSGARKGKHHSYALFDERVKKSKQLVRDQALAELANRYFTSHGPATIKDFGWWSGLSVGDSKRAVELNGTQLRRREIGDQVYFAKHFAAPHSQPRVFLLPAFDEFLIAYKDRSASIHRDHSPHAFTSNGIFRPLILAGGQVVGTWKRSVKNDDVSIEFSFFEKPRQSQEDQLVAQAENFARFLGKKVQLKF